MANIEIVAQPAAQRRARAGHVTGDITGAVVLAIAFM